MRVIRDNFCSRHGDRERHASRMCGIHDQAADPVDLMGNSASDIALSGNTVSSLEHHGWKMIASVSYPEEEFYNVHFFTLSSRIESVKLEAATQDKWEALWLEMG